MRGLGIALRAEAYRTLHTRAMWLSLGLLLLIASGYVVLGHLSESVGMRPAAPEGLEQGGGGWVHFVDAWRFTLSATCLLLLIHASRYVSSDRESGILRLGLVRSSSRSAALLGRAAMGPPLVLGAFLASGLGAWLTCQLFYDFGPLIEDGYELMSAEELQAELLAASLATLLPLMALHSCALMLSAWSTRPIHALSLALVGLLCFDFFKDFLGQSLSWFFAGYAPTFSDSSALHEMSGLASGFSDMGFSDEQLMLSFLVPLPYMVLSLAVACWSITRRPA